MDAFADRDDVEPQSDAHLQRDLEAVMACQVARLGEVFDIKGLGEVDGVRVLPAAVVLLRSSEAG